jgi:peptidoglycan/LPS O-acetylase OafA/YrhL
MASSSATTPERDFRPEIQALRAVAVVAVVVFHFWPNRLSGGYVGVDVFFVVSGYLITAHLLRDVRATGRVAVAAFWARRIRRLLPASLLVLLVTTVAVLALVPGAFWTQFLREVAASALYVENWLLAADSVDYLAAENSASPVQHYWSLSAEEQFYLAWPLLIVGATALARGRAARRIRFVFVVLSLVTTLSLAFSIVATAVAPAPAYFITPTRAWEFGAGALLAFLPREVLDARLPRHAAAGLSWAGFTLIALAAVVYTADTPFPGFAALLPVGGTLAVLAAGLPGARWAPSRLLALRPVQFLGDVSYSVYLWHWPLLILLPLALGAPLGAIAKIAALVGCVGLAWLTKVFVEDPARRWRPLATARPRRTLTAMAVAMAVVVAMPLGAVAVQRAAVAGQAEAIDAAARTPCVGAAAFEPGEDCAESRGDLLPARSTVYDDTQGAFACYDSTPDGDLPACSFGSTADDALRVALIGDSHGAMLVPGLTDQAAAANWHVDVFVSRGCVWSQSDLTNLDNSCHTRNAAMHELLTTGTRYDLVLLAARRSLDVPQGEPYVAFAQAAPQWQAVLDRGTRIVAVADNPLVPPELVDCVVTAADDAAARDCAFPEQDAYRWADGLADAARAEPRVGLIDLRAYFCRDATCPMVIGDVIVYRDRDHMTATYSRTLARFLVAEVNELRAD